MDDNKFWDIVAKVDWPGLCAGGGGTKAGTRLMTELLPTFEEAEQFQENYHQKLRVLRRALNAWEKEGYHRSFGVSDDGFDDLTSHIVGCGKEHYEAVLKDPSLAHKRAMAPYGTPEGYTESFSYCLPHKEDYDSLEVKLVRARSGFHYWSKRLYEDPSDLTSQREVSRRALEVAALMGQMTGEPVDEAEIQRQVHKLKLEAQQHRVAELREQATKLAERLAEEEIVLVVMESAKP